MKTLVCNAGSSSLKFSLLVVEGELLRVEGGIDWSTTPTRLVVHYAGQPEAREELTLQHYASGRDARPPGRAPDHCPPRQRRLGVGGAPRPLRRYLHGLHAAGGLDDGY